jgi:hypothetical protein
MIAGFRDLLAWLLGWKAAGVVFPPPAGQVVTIGQQAGQIDVATAAAARVDTPGPLTGQIHG